MKRYVMIDTSDGVPFSSFVLLDCKDTPQFFGKFIRGWRIGQKSAKGTFQILHKRPLNKDGWLANRARKEFDEDEIKEIFLELL